MPIKDINGRFKNPKEIEEKLKKFKENDIPIADIIDNGDALNQRTQPNVRTLIKETNEALIRIDKSFLMFDFATPELAKLNITDLDIFELIENTKREIDEKIIRHTKDISNDYDKRLRENWEILKSNIAITNHIKEEIKTNSTLLEEVLYNLISNTIEHSFDENNKNVSVSIDFKEDKNDYFILYTNTGRRIEAETNVFESGYTTKGNKKNGICGVGLWGTQYIIKNILGGEISILENKEKKVTFKIQIKKI
jgi:signal transduction histidine kinase